MKIRQAWKIYFRFFGGDYKEMPYKWNTYITAVRVVTKRVLRNFDKECKRQRLPLLRGPLGQSR